MAVPHGRGGQQHIQALKPASLVPKMVLGKHFIFPFHLYFAHIATETAALQPVLSCPLRCRFRAQIHLGQEEMFPRALSCHVQLSRE